MKKRIFTILTGLCSIFLLVHTVSCIDEKDKPVKPTTGDAEIVVYGTIYTAEDGAMAEAFAVKEGKFVYVGDKAGAAGYVGADTRVIDHIGQGMVLPGLTEGHGHYFISMLSRFTTSASISAEDSPTQVLEKMKDAYRRAKNMGRGYVSGMGWELHKMHGTGFLETARIEIDKIIPDIPAFFYDTEGHKALVNTECLKRAGIIRQDGTCTIKPDTIRGGVIYLDKDNMPTGLISEQACPYISSNGIDYDNLQPFEVYWNGVQLAQEFLLSMEFTSVLEALATKVGPTGIYKACKALDDKNMLKMNIMAAYGIDSYNDYKKEIQKAKERQVNYSSRHFHPDYIKLFMDGTREQALDMLTINGA
ncbi:MAG: amidohydrolase family protein [Prevotella sp.]|nr:amidohydrolase family protein [Prevotella sp.]